MKNKFKSIVSSLALALCWGQAAQATNPTLEVPTLAVINQTAGMAQRPDASQMLYLSREIRILDDGLVVVNTKFSRNGNIFEEVTYPFYFVDSDIVSFRKSVRQLRAEGALIEDTQAPILCDAGSTQYKVVLGNEIVTLQEINDCAPTRIRAERSKLEVRVIQVMDKLLDAYRQSRP